MAVVIDKLITDMEQHKELTKEEYEFVLDSVRFRRAFELTTSSVGVERLLRSVADNLEKWRGGHK